MGTAPARAPVGRTARTPGIGRLPSLRARLALGGLVAVSLGVHLWGFLRELPTPDVDERYFAIPAATIAATGDPNPHWFGHPGSTVIYPLALAYRLREVVFHGAPLTGPAPGVARRFLADPSSFYLIGRVWAMLFSVAAVVLVFAIGRWLFSELVGVVAAAVWTVVPIAVQYGRITRTDSVGVFFTLLTVWACLRALDEPTGRRFAVAGVAAGLAMASRYLLASLAVMLVTAWILARRAPRDGPARDDHAPDALAVDARALLAGLAAMAATFVCTTPFLFLDASAAVQSISAEAATRVPFQSHGFLDNLSYYLDVATPRALSWIDVAAAALGIALALRYRRPATTLVLVWLPCFVFEICVIGVHWDRWLIPVLPILAVFAAAGAVNAARYLAERWTGLPGTARHLVRPLGFAVLLALVAFPAVATVSLDRAAAEPSTRAQADRWIDRHLPAGSRVAVEIRGPDLFASSYSGIEHYSLPNVGTVSDYAAAGYRYLVVNAGIAHRYRDDAARDPRAAAFYDYLRDDARLLANFAVSSGDTGPHLQVYDLGPSRKLRDPDTDPESRLEAITLRLSPVDTVARQRGAVPSAERRLRLAATG